jgi:hypothetical protein
MGWESAMDAIFDCISRMDVRIESMSSMLGCMSMWVDFDDDDGGYVRDSIFESRFSSTSDSIFFPSIFSTIIIINFEFLEKESEIS